ncbi:MAG: hypothetical protein M1602_06880 [Firmicutes bacterium]|nr:hypothetical protein [Bacillota bacterium]
MTLFLALVATSSVAFVAWRLAAAPSGFAWHERLLLLAGVAWAQTVLTQLLAGTVFRLTPLWVAALNVGLVLVAGLRLKPAAAAVPGHLAAGGADTTGAPAPAEPGDKVPPLWRALQTAATGQTLPWLLLGLLVLQSALVLWTAAVLPPQGWDEWWYHLPPIARWVETGRVDLMPVAQEWQDPAQVQALDDYQRRYRLSVTGFWANVYPLNVETAAMWSLLFLRQDRWVDAAQWPLVLLGALAVYSLVRWARVKAPGPMVAGLLWALLPINQMQARTAYTDTAVAAATLAAVLFFLRWVEAGADRGSGPKSPARGRSPNNGGVMSSTPRTGNATASAYFLAFGLFLGLSVGSKPSALGYAGVLGVLTLIVALRKARSQPVWARLRQAAGCGLTLAVVALATGGFWYLRTWIVYGNPIYPFSVKVLGAEIFQGLGSVHSLIWVANTPEEYLHTGFFSNLARSWFEASQEPYSFYTRTGGFGAIWAVVGLPALVVYAVRSLWRRDRRGLSLLGLGALMLVVHPGSWWPRYSILVPGLGLIGAGWLLGEGVGAAAATGRGPRNRGLQAQFSALVVVATLWSLLRADLSLSQGLPMALALKPEQRTIGRLYLGDYAPLEQRVPWGASIGYAPMTFIYPLYGPELQRRVEQVDGLSPSAWLESIKQTGVSYVSVLKSYGPHYAWAKAAPNWLEEIATPGEVGLFAVKAGAFQILDGPEAPGAAGPASGSAVLR